MQKDQAKKLFEGASIFFVITLRVIYRFVTATLSQNNIRCVTKYTKLWFSNQKTAESQATEANILTNYEKYNYYLL